MTTDVVLNQDKGYYDISWNDDGDLTTDQTLDTYILMCLLEEVRASSSEIITAELRSGWLGNESTPDFEIGSKIYQLSQERVTGTLLSDLRAIVRSCLEVMIDENIALDVTVDQPEYKDGKIQAPITLFRDGSPPDRRYYVLWDNTAQSGGSF